MCIHAVCMHFSADVCTYVCGPNLIDVYVTFSVRLNFYDIKINFLLLVKLTTTDQYSLWQYNN